MAPPQQTVVVGMSGGVDSSVAALLLHQQGYRVIGLFMKNWEEQDESGVCSAAADYADVARVCEQIGIPHYAVNFVQEYWDRVFVEFIADYKAGHTPNPDILCNREIKFAVFFDMAMKLGADYLATGHYCRNELRAGEHRLIKAVDAAKDQTYFLYTIGKATLRQVLFPIGDLPKREVRAIAERHDLATHAKKDSTGVCFIGERDFPEFLGRYIAAQPGEFQTIAGVPVGQHQGAAYYTIGQRKGLGLGGAGEPWFVVGKDMSRQVVHVERGERHPALYCDELIASEVSWVSGAPPQPGSFRCKMKLRYRQSDQDCAVTELGDGQLQVRFDLPQRAVARRQSMVFYADDMCLDGAIVEQPGPSYHERGLALPPLVAR